MMNSAFRPSRSVLPLLLVSLALFVPTVAHAHVGVGPTSGLLHGFAHPISGLDHICAMLAVGLWAAQRGGRALWLVPLTFVSVMAVGGCLGMAGIAVPFVEEGIVASVLVLGVLIAAAVQMPLAASVGMVGLLAIFHGHAHGVEMPPTASGLTYGLGFVLATALLHATGMAIGLLVNRLGSVHLVRWAGGAVALCGVYLGFALAHGG